MDATSIFAIILGVVGIIGGFIPILPGPPISWVALLLTYFSDRADGQVTTTSLIIWLIITILVTILDYILPGIFAKATGGHKGATRGANIGLIIGLFLTPIGMILGSFIGAFLGEYFSEMQDFSHSLKAAFGTFIAFICTTGMKVICSVIIFVNILKFIF